MARRIDLQSYQEYLSNRLLNQHENWLMPPLLGFSTREDMWLIPLTEARGVHALPTIVPLPFAPEYQLGLANLRGVIYSVTDWSRLLGGQFTVPDRKARLLLLGKQHPGNIALLVSQTLGLFEVSKFIRTEEANDNPWCKEKRYDAEGKCWRVLASDQLIELHG